MSGGDKAFEKKLLEIIKNEFPQEKASYFNNIKAGNMIEAAQYVHKIKHKISILGLEKSFIIATKYEDRLKKGNPDLENEFNSIIKEITTFIKNF